MANSEGSFEDVQIISATCDKLVEDTVQGRCSMEEFGELLCHMGITVEAAGDYVREVKTTTWRSSQQLTKLGNCINELTA